MKIRNRERGTVGKDENYHCKDKNSWGREEKGSEEVRDRGEMNRRGRMSKGRDNGEKK